MKIKGIVDEDFINYKEPSMYIAFPKCTFKCDIENGCALCQNSALAKEPDIEVKEDELVKRYINNSITKAIVLAGLEPFDSAFEVLRLIDCFRNKYNQTDPIIIYTGYTEEELDNGSYCNAYKKSHNKAYAYLWDCIKRYGVIVKFGRYKPNQKSHFDKVLGIKLVSDNQYAKEFYEDKSN